MALTRSVWLLAPCAVVAQQVAAYREARLHIAPALGAIGASIGASLPDSCSDCLAGLLAGMFAAALTTPLDVLVTHAAVATEGADGRPLRRTPLQIGVTLVQEEGLASLTRGMMPRTVYYATVCGFFFALYEYFRRILEAHGL